MKNTISEELTGIGVTGSNVDLETKRYNGSKQFVLQRVSVTNETNNGDTATIGIKVGSNILWLETVTITTAGLYYAITDATFVNEGHSVIVRFKGTTNADKLKAFVFGYVRK